MSLTGFDQFEDYHRQPRSRRPACHSVRGNRLTESPRGTAIPPRSRRTCDREGVLRASRRRSVGMYHYILINPSNDFEITERFFHLTAAERARAHHARHRPARLSEGYARKLSYEDWARTRPDVKAGVPLFSRASGFFPQSQP